MSSNNAIRLIAQRRSREHGVHGPSETTLRIVRSLRLQQSTKQAVQAFIPLAAEIIPEKHSPEGETTSAKKKRPNVSLQIALKRCFALSVLAAAGVSTASPSDTLSPSNGSLRSSCEHCAERQLPKYTATLTGITARTAGGGGVELRQRKVR